MYEFLIANPSIFERLGKLSKYKIATLAKNAPVGPSLVGWFLCDVIDENIASDILKTFQDCVPQTDKGGDCPAFYVFKHIQKARAQKVQINKNEFPGLWLFALDYMMIGKTPSRVAVQKSHLPGQGHEGSTELKDYFRGLNEVN